MKSKLITGSFKIGVFFLAFFIACGLTILSWLFAFAKDEGQIDGNTEWIQNFIADGLNVFRFPTHTLFEQLILSDRIVGYLYFPGLLLNCVFWAFVTERFVSIGTEIYNGKRKVTGLRTIK